MKLKDYLTEEINITDGNSFLKYLEKGMIQGTGKKKFFEDKAVTNVDLKLLDSFINKVRSKAGDDFNPFFTFVVRKIGTFNSLTDNWMELDSWLDSVVTYFKNKNKQEFKNDDDLKKIKDDFESGGYNYNKDKEFEQIVNKKFADKAKVKDKNKEIEEVYKDSEGWEVLTPLTFAASKELACMNGRKSEWCTAASSSMFDRYTNNNNKLFIIRNKTKNIMFQMDFGEIPNFKNEKDNAAGGYEFLKHEPPEEMMKSIKNKNGKSLFSFISPKKINPSFIRIGDGWLKRETDIYGMLKYGKAPGFGSLENIIYNNYDKKIWELKDEKNLFFIIFEKNKSFSYVFEYLDDTLIKRNIKDLVTKDGKFRIPESILKSISSDKLDLKQFLNKKENTEKVHGFSGNEKFYKGNLNTLVDIQQEADRRPEKVGLLYLKKNISAAKNFDSDNMIFSVNSAISFKDGKFRSVGEINKKYPKNPFDTFIELSRVKQGFNKELLKSIGATDKNISDMERMKEIIKMNELEELSVYFPQDSSASAMFDKIYLKKDETKYIISFGGTRPMLNNGTNNRVDKIELDLVKDKKEIDIFRDLIRLRAKYS